MKRSSRFVSIALTGVMLLGLAVPTAGFAAPFNKNKGNGVEILSAKQGPPSWVLDKFERMQKGRVFLNGTVIRFDSDPVNKGGRILIPVRAITEGMGGEVQYDSKTQTVTITSPEVDTEIVFYLATGIVKVDGKEVQIDVKPGIHNNRTYVPLRFIAETFGLKVGYNGNTGDIDINNGPRLSPTQVTFEDEDDVKDVDVKLILNDYDFIGITGLNSGDFSYDEDDAVVTLDNDYIEELDEEKTLLTFKFEDSDDKALTRTFTINLEYNEEEVLPVISPQRVTFDDEDDIEDVTIDLTRNGYSFEGIQGLEEDEDYDVDGNEVTIDNNYIEDLDEEVTTLYLLFEDDGETVKKAFQIRLPFIEDFEKPTISPSRVTFDEVDDVTDVVVNIDFNDYEAKAIKNGNATLTAGVHYRVDDNRVIFDEDYLKSFDDESTDLTFVFEDEDGEEYELDFEVIIEEL